MAAHLKVCDEKTLKDGDILGFDYEVIVDNSTRKANKRLLIAKIGGKIYATDGICTHQYADLSQGFLNEDEKTVTCPLHLSAFSLEKGIPLNPPAEEPLRTYEVMIKPEDGGVYVLLND
jgi:3-phenylpropionate/trans-cinnamate dioxygenase ferredoxin component